MARARNIKPGFFANEDLVELPFATRLLFIGLWTLADREGRLEDRPKRIKMALFPADNLDVEESLNSLAASGFLTRYEHDGERYIQVTSFAKHQNPHRDEKASTIPAPCKHGANTVQEQCEHGGNRADSLILRFSDSPIPDSLNPEPASNGQTQPVREEQSSTNGAVLSHVALSVEFRKHGIKAQPADPRLLALASQGVTVETVASACVEARSAKPDAGFGYVLAILERWAKQAKEIKVSGASPQNARASPSYQTANEKAKDFADRLTGRKPNEQRNQLQIIDIN